jgi:hypothetical protein
VTIEIAIEMNDCLATDARVTADPIGLLDLDDEVLCYILELLSVQRLGIPAATLPLGMTFSTSSASELSSMALTCRRFRYLVQHRLRTHLVIRLKASPPYGLQRLMAIPRARSEKGRTPIPFKSAVSFDIGVPFKMNIPFGWMRPEFCLEDRAQGSIALNIEASDCASLASLKSLTAIDMISCRITDPAKLCAKLAVMTHLRTLCLSTHSTMTTGAFIQLSALTNLQTLAIIAVETPRYEVRV